eukprot:1038349-Rhodomonas_salina.1
MSFPNTNSAFWPVLCSRWGSKGSHPSVNSTLEAPRAQAQMDLEPFSQPEIPQIQTPCGLKPSCCREWDQVKRIFATDSITYPFLHLLLHADLELLSQLCLEVMPHALLLLWRQREVRIRQ